MRRNADIIDEGKKEYPMPGAIPSEDTESVVAFYKLPRAFPKAVREEVARLPGVDNSENRLDLRKKFIFTCDPVTARDYDDALSLWKDRLGRRVLGVHIADVSHYVRPGGAIDREACKRSTSIYLVDRVIPMLPEALSNGVCSLKPREDRLAFSVFMTFNAGGDVVKATFAKSIINSKARFTYEQVMGIIQGQGSKARGKAGFGGIGRREASVIRDINALAQQMRAKRFSMGALDLEVPEMEVSLDGEGQMTGITAMPYDESHQMIEECMVAANEAVAKELWTHNIKILARYHEAPDPEKLHFLREELRPLGIKCGNLENPKVFAQFLQTIKKSPLYPTIAVMVLRSMKRALYDAKEMGHWGLAKRFYAHFTSPIRRYPDLTLHRQLAAYLAASKGAKVSPRMAPQALERLAKYTSDMEERAAEAERALLEIKKYRILEEELTSRMPVEYEAIISKCERFGCFVDIPSLAVSGLVHISLLSSRYVKYNESDHSLSSPGGGSWHVGDRLKVRVAKVDFANRYLDFVPVDGSASGSRGKRCAPAEPHVRMAGSPSANRRSQGRGRKGLPTVFNQKRLRKNNKLNKTKGKKKHGTLRSH